MAPLANHVRLDQFRARAPTVVPPAVLCLAEVFRSCCMTELVAEEPLDSRTGAPRRKSGHLLRRVDLSRYPRRPRPPFPVVLVSFMPRRSLNRNCAMRCASWPSGGRTRTRIACGFHAGSRSPALVAASALPPCRKDRRLSPIIGVAGAAGPACPSERWRLRSGIGTCAPRTSVAPAASE